MLMNDISLKVETNDISGKSNACSFEPYAKNGNASILARYGMMSFVFSDPCRLTDVDEINIGKSFLTAQTSGKQVPMTDSLALS